MITTINSTISLTAATSVTGSAISALLFKLQTPSGTLISTQVQMTLSQQKDKALNTDTVMFIILT